MKTKRSLPALRIADSLTLFAALALPAAALAQAYPTKPIRYVVAFAAGDSPDIIARIAGEHLSRLWKQQVVVENRTGAGGTIAGGYVAKAPPDGYTLLHCNIATNAIALALYNKLPYDGLKDFAPVTRMATTSNVFVAHPSLPAKNMKEFVQYAKAHPGKLSFGHGGIGASPHLSMELLKTMANIRIEQVAYKGASPAFADLMGGQIPLAIGNLPGALAYIKAGRMRALAVTSAIRAPQVPDIPTMVESGFPDYVVTSWYGACAPAGTPSAVLDKLNADISKVLNAAEVKQRLTDLVMTVATTSRDEFTTFMREEAARWAKVARAAGIPRQ